jgi:hypothetical protein
VTRRTLIQGLAILLLGFAASIWLISRKRLLRVLSRLTVNLLGPRLDASSPTGVLEPADLDSVVAFAEVLVEGVPLPSEGLQILVEHVNERTRTTPGYLPLYRATATALDRLANRPFSALDLPERTTVIMEHGLAHPVRLWEYFVPLWRHDLAVRLLAVPDLIDGYYRSAAGWAIVGYAAFPGRCGDLLRYTRSEP